MSAAFRARAVPWLLPGVLLAELALVVSGHLALGTAVGVVVAIEILLLLTAAGRTRAAIRGYRCARTSGRDPWAAAEGGLAQLVPRRLAHLILLEVRLWIGLGRWLTGRHDGRTPMAFSYHHGLTPIIRVIIMLVVVEGGVVEFVLLIALPRTAWPWIALALHAYGVLAILGLNASMVTRPHLLTSDGLRLRDGVFTEVAIPAAAIRDVRPVRRTNLGRSGFTIDHEARTATLAHADVTIALALDPTCRIVVNGVVLDSPVATINITVDSPRELVTALRHHPGISPATTTRHAET